MKKYFYLLLFTAVTLTTFTLQSCCKADGDQTDPIIIRTTQPTLSGYVYSSEGGVLKGAKITVTVDGKVVATTTTGTDGHYSITKGLPEGIVYAEASYTSEYGTEGEYPVLVNGTETPQDFTLVKTNTTSKEAKVDEEVDPTKTVSEENADLILKAQLPVIEEGQVSASDFAYFIVPDLYGSFPKAQTSKIIFTMNTTIQFEDITSSAASKAEGDKNEFAAVLTSEVKSSDPTMTEAEEEFKIAFTSDLKPDKVTHAGEEISSDEIYASEDGKLYYFLTKKLGVTTYTFYVTEVEGKTVTEKLAANPSSVVGPATQVYYYDYMSGCKLIGYTSKFLKKVMASRCSNYNAATIEGEGVCDVQAGYTASLYGLQSYTDYTYYFTNKNTLVMNVREYNSAMAAAEIAKDHTGGSN